MSGINPQAFSTDDDDECISTFLSGQLYAHKQQLQSAIVINCVMSTSLSLFLFNADKIILLTPLVSQNSAALYV